MRIGIDIGGTSVKLGLVDSENSMVAEASVPSGSEITPEKLMEKVAEAIKGLLKDNGLDIADCESVGMGIPGTIDDQNGVVIYSNNLCWENFYIRDELKKYIDLPVRLANDADAAALGEAVACQSKNMIMVTLGTGVGGGVIIDGKLFAGRMIGGSELGHTVIVHGGRPCTCGRKGCLESYASATALRNRTEEVYGKKMDAKELFELYHAGDDKAKQIVDEYIEMLGCGMVNLVNLFRPERILIGGGISAQENVILPPIRDMLKKECFGGEHGQVPELAVATLGNKAGIIGAANL